MDMVCSKCGSVGFAERIVTCAACRRISEHTYCMQNLWHNDPSIWKCEDCTANGIEPPPNGIEPPKRRHTVLLEDAPNETHVKRICTYTRRDPKKLTGSGRQLSGTQILRAPCRTSAQMPRVLSGDKRKISDAIPRLGALSAPTKSANIKTATISSSTHTTPLSPAAKTSNTHSHVMKRATGASLHHALPKFDVEAGSRDKERNANDCKTSGKRDHIVFGNKEPLEKNVGTSSPMNDTSIAKSNSATVLQCQSNIEEMKTLTAMTLEGGCRALVNKILVAECHIAGSTENAPSRVTKTYNKAVIIKPSGNTVCSDNNNFPLRHRLILDGKHPHRPLPNAYWRGDFKISDTISTACHEIHGIRAHIPGYVSNHVYETVKGLSGKNIGLKLCNRMGIWPKVFQLDPPDFDDVGLYFFPSEEQRSKVIFKHLVDMLDVKGFAMQSRIDNAELLIFTSAQLPQDPHAIGVNTEVYLWGVFRRIRTINRTPADQGKQTCGSPTSRNAMVSEGQAAGGSPQFRAGGMAFGRANGPVSGPDVPPGFTKICLRKSSDAVKEPDVPGFLKSIYNERKATSITDIHAADIPQPAFAKPNYPPNRR